LFVGEKKRPFNANDLKIICHFFYLPYESGAIAVSLVKSFKWLKENVIDFTKEPQQVKVSFAYLFGSPPSVQNRRKSSRRSVFFTIWHCIFSAQLAKTHSFRLFLWRFYPLGWFWFLVLRLLVVLPNVLHIKVNRHAIVCYLFQISL